jgi:hypothetical protein
MPPSAREELRELERRWVDAETRADTSALDALATGDFTLVGPAGFVLDKQQWLDRYRRGSLRTHSLAVEDSEPRLYGDTAVTVGVQRQEAEYEGHPASGEFRITRIAVRRGEEWLLAGLHLSPLGGPPPFGPPAGR